MYDGAFCNIFAKRPVADVSQGSKCACAYRSKNSTFAKGPLARILDIYKKAVAYKFKGLLSPISMNYLQQLAKGHPIF